MIDSGDRFTMNSAAVYIRLSRYARMAITHVREYNVAEEWMVTTGGCYEVIRVIAL